MKRPPAAVDVHPDCCGLRTILVPPDIVAVARRSAPRVRKRTPWRPQPDGQQTTERPGQREWFSDGLFVEARDGHERSGYGTSAVVHVFAVAALLLFLITRPEQPAIVRSASLVMPTVVAPLPTMPVVDAPATPAERPQSKAASVVPAAAALPAPPIEASTGAPVEAPSGITPETGNENRVASVAGVEGGVAGGVAGGVVGGVGHVPAAPGPAGPTILRAGTDVKPPRKIRDVKPVYPASALPTRAQGAVIIEATIGPDGRVQEAKVVHSIPGLDQAALDAVRRWEYEPSTLNGAAIAVLMTIVVNFALQ